MDVLASAAGAFAVDRRAVVVELQGDTDNVIARPRQQRGGDGGVDPAGHCRQHARADRQPDGFACSVFCGADFVCGGGVAHCGPHVASRRRNCEAQR